MEVGNRLDLLLQRVRRFEENGSRESCSVPAAVGTATVSRFPLANGSCAVARWPRLASARVSTSVVTWLVVSRK